MDHTGQSTVDAAETVELNNLLTGNQELFLDRLCLIRLSEGGHLWGNESTFLWPAIEYRNKQEFLEDVKEKVDQSFEVRFNLAPRLADIFNQHPFQLPGCRIAFLLCMQTIEDSVITLGVGVGMVEKFAENIDELLKNDDYKDNEKFMEAVEIVSRRIGETFDDATGEDEDNHANVEDNHASVGFDLAKFGFNSGDNPPLPSSLIPSSLMDDFNSEV